MSFVRVGRLCEQDLELAVGPVWTHASSDRQGKATQSTGNWGGDYGIDPLWGVDRFGKSSDPGSSSFWNIPDGLAVKAARSPDL